MWRQVQKIKTVNASCANNNFVKAVQEAGTKCFEKCSPTDRANVTSDCSTLCVFETILGRSRSFPNSTYPGMTADELVAPWQAAFESEDPTKNGCPAL